MKFFVRMITVIALLLVMVGGASMDSEDIMIPMLTALPGFAWFAMIAWANRER